MLCAVNNGVQVADSLMSMSGRCVLITGAASGIGKATALRFAEAGASLFLVDQNELGLADAAAEVHALVGNLPHIRRTDLTEKDEIEALWQQVGDKIDVLVNNAGLYPLKGFLSIDELFLRKVLDVNMESVFWMCQEFVARRKGKGGNIINVSSIEAILPFKEGMAAYSMGKAGVLALTRALAHDYGREGFRINALLPGAIRTPGTQSMVKQAIKRVDLKLVKAGIDFQARLALGRWGRPDEVACVALFLASNLASYVHGAAIPVDGGFLSS